MQFNQAKYVDLLPFKYTEVGISSIIGIVQKIMLYFFSKSKDPGPLNHRLGLKYIFAWQSDRIIFLSK